MNKDYMYYSKTYSASLVYWSQAVLGSILGSGRVIGFFHQEFINSCHGVWIYARLMAIGSPLIT